MPNGPRQSWAASVAASSASPSRIASTIEGSRRGIGRAGVMARTSRAASARRTAARRSRPIPRRPESRCPAPAGGRGCRPRAAAPRRAARRPAARARRPMPTSIRARCGTSRPTNTIGPAAAVAAPHSIEITAPQAISRRPRWMPSASACSSPIATTSSGRASARLAARPASRQAARIGSMASPRSATEPTAHSRNCSRLLGWSRLRPAVVDSRLAPSAVPVSSSRTGSLERDSRREANTRPATTAAPAKARPNCASGAITPAPDAEHHEQPRARVDAEDAGAGQGIARESLDQATGQAECAAHQDREFGARQPVVADRRPGLALRVPQRTQRERDRQAMRADQQAEHRQARQQRAERDQRQPPGAARRRGGALACRETAANGRRCPSWRFQGPGCSIGSAAAGDRGDRPDAREVSCRVVKWK